nr:MAG TPA: hypothetical protein [Caudoviricetes sp.]
MLWLVATKGCTHSEPNCVLTIWFYYYNLLMCILHLKLYEQQLTPFGSLRAFYSKETGALNVLGSY